MEREEKKKQEKRDKKEGDTEEPRPVTIIKYTMGLKHQVWELESSTSLSSFQFIHLHITYQCPFLTTIITMSVTPKKNKQLLIVLEMRFDKVMYDVLVAESFIFWQVWKLKGEEYRVHGMWGWQWVSYYRRAPHIPMTSVGLRAGGDKYMLPVKGAGGLKTLSLNPAMYRQLATKSAALKPSLLSPNQRREEGSLPNADGTNDLLITMASKKRLTYLSFSLVTMMSVSLHCNNDERCGNEFAFPE